MHVCSSGGITALETSQQQIALCLISNHCTSTHCMRCLPHIVCGFVQNISPRCAMHMLQNTQFFSSLQYTARLNADKLKNIIHRLNGGRIGKQYFNMRLCPEDVSDKLSGYEHNAVSPIGIKAPLPVILSHRCGEAFVDIRCCIQAVSLEP